MTKTDKETKAQAHWLIDQLEEEATWEDVAYHVNVRASIERGLADVAAGRTLTHDEVRQRLGLGLDQGLGQSRTSEPITRSKTDWAHFDALTDDDIDLSDIPELSDEQITRMKVHVPMHQVPLLLDPDIYRWLKRNAHRKRDLINQCLRDLMDSQDE